MSIPEPTLRPRSPNAHSGSLAPNAGALLIVVAAFEAPAVIAGLGDVAVVS